jgi:hypothetical protein
MAGVCLQPAQVDGLATFEAVAVLARLDAAQRAFDAGQLLLAPAAGLERHLLGLHSIHSRQPPHPCLVEEVHPNLAARG